MRIILPKSTYLVILYLLFAHMWGLAPFNMIGSNGYLLLTFAYLLWGTYIYRNGQKYIFRPTYYYCMIAIALGFIGSMFTANMYYRQTFMQSIVAYRMQYLIFTPLFLAKIAPSEHDVIKSLKTFSYIYVIGILARIAFPSLFNVSEDVLNTFGFEIVLGGISLLPIILFYTLQKIAHRVTANDIIYATMLLIIIFVAKNRSILFPVLILTCYMIIRIKSRYKWIIVLLLLSIGFLALYSQMEDLNDLVTETQENISDSDYNRNKAFKYFVTSFSPNWQCEVFGNGFLSNHASRKMAILREEGIVNSDMGFIGYWNQFGLIPIITFLCLYISAIQKKRISIYLKLVAIQTLVCSLTISYFGTPMSTIWFIIFFYLYYIEQATPKHSSIRTKHKR